MPRFTVLLHETPPDYPRPRHWDLLLARGAYLQTWALAQPPTNDTPIVADELPPHRLMYLDYEGPISGERGKVTQVDTGEYTLDTDQPDVIKGELFGGALNGRFCLTRSDGNAQMWEFRFLP